MSAICLSEAMLAFLLFVATDDEDATLTDAGDDLDGFNDAQLLTRQRELGVKSVARREVLQAELDRLEGIFNPYEKVQIILDLDMKVREQTEARS